MGDLVIESTTSRTKLRISHEDFANRGIVVGGNYFISLADLYPSMKGYEQYGIFHCVDTEVQERNLSGHNAGFFDMAGTTTIFASAIRLESGGSRAKFPNAELDISHEVSSYRSIEGQSFVSHSKEKSKWSIWDLFKRK